MGDYAREKDIALWRQRDEDQSLTRGIESFSVHFHYNFLLMGTCLLSALMNSQIESKIKELLYQKLE